MLQGKRLLSQNSNTIGYFSLAKDTFVYLVGSALSGLASFILLPIYTRSLTPSDFGVYALLDVTILVIVTVAQVGLSVSYLKWFADEGVSRRSELLGTVLIGGAIVAVVGGGLLTLVVVSPLGEQLLQTTERKFAWTLLPIVVLENLQTLLINDLRARRRTMAFSTYAFVRLLAVTGFGWWLIVVQDQGIFGLFLGRLAGAGVSFLLLIVLSLPIKMQPDWSTFFPMLRYGWPLVWSSLVAMLLDASGRYFLSHYTTLEQVGFYSVSIKIASIFQVLLQQPFNTAWGGLMFQIVKMPNARLIYSKILLYLFTLSMIAALVLALFTPILFAVFATVAYIPVMAVLPVIFLVRAISIMEYPAAIGIYLRGRTQWFAAIYSVGLVVNVFANYLLVPTYEVFGAAWAWFVAWLTITILMACLGQYYYPLDYEWKWFLIPIMGWLVLLMGQQWFAFVTDGTFWLLRMVLAVIVTFSVIGLIGRDFWLVASKLGERR
ncbi:MAG: hypothetical protein KatS3mg087_2127 [Patescibacteria group bacterium]|nr:MAG: hypothetical protein KatS3mg055_0870 [Chloroflexus sp.]GIW61061.1 MAG: hypothetical protein KatS3mg087_2127 [Patescibacteria group bacterium]